jgi:hypothetical protein
MVLDVLTWVDFGLAMMVQTSLGAIMRLDSSEVEVWKPPLGELSRPDAVVVYA